MNKRTSGKTIVDKTITNDQKKLLDKTMELGNNHFLSIGDLVYHVTVPKLGYGIIVAQSHKHKNYWIIKWCDIRYSDVGELGIHAQYLAKVN